jgi:hypothetical protein
MSNEIQNLCPVCGFDLDRPSWLNDRTPSFEICPCCGIQFGYHDLSKNRKTRELTYIAWRVKWKDSGFRFHHAWLQPLHWDVAKQLKAIGIKVKGISL